jgi:hypothetical protein
MPNVPEETYENEDEQNQEYEQNYDDVVYDEGTAFAATLTLLDGLGNSMWPMPRIQHLNYTAEQLDELRQEHRLALQEMATTIMELKKVPPGESLGTEFWEQDELQPVLQLPGVQLQKGSMCNFGLRGRDLLKKDTGW